MDKLSIDIKDFSLNQDLYKRTMISYITKIDTHISGLMPIEYFPDHIRRFNESASYLCMDINKFKESYEDIKNLQNDKTTSFAEKSIINTNFRKSARDVCVGIESYTEKIKALCRFYFYMDEESTENGLEWFETIKQFEKINKGKYITAFLDKSINYISMKEYSLIKNLRNDEMHNESIIEMKEYRPKANKKTPGDFDNFYLLSEDMLFKSVKVLIDSLKKVASAFNKMIMNLSLSDVYNYIDSNKKVLKNIITPDERVEKNKQKIKRYKNIVKDLDKQE